MGLIPGHDPICKEICEALGLNTKNTRSIDIRLAVDEVVKAKVETYTDKGEVIELLNIIKKHGLVVGDELNPLRRVVRGMINNLRFGPDGPVPGRAYRI